MLSRDGPRDFADINIAARIEREAVRRDELPSRFARPDVAEAREDFSFLGENAEARPEIRAVLVDRHARPELAEIAEGLAASIHIERARAVHVMPLIDEFSAAVEDLNPV